MECWFLWRKKNQRVQRRTLETKTRTNNKFDPLMSPDPGYEHGYEYWRRRVTGQPGQVLKPFFCGEGGGVGFIYF